MRSTSHSVFKILMVFSLAVISGCLCGTKSSYPCDLPISNTGVSFTHTMDVLRVRVPGENERNILQMKQPPIEALLLSLNDPDKWIAAHVLLTIRYEHVTTNDMYKWNGLNIWLAETSKSEMIDIRAYWVDKEARGDLEIANPAYTEEIMNQWL